MKPMLGYIPANLNLISEKHRDKYYFLITFIFYGRIFDKRKDSASFIQLNSIFLKNIINGRYKDYLQDLINMHIIETDNHYILKEKFKAYRLTENFRNVKTKQIKIEDEKIVSNYWNYKSVQKKKISEIPHKYIFSCLEQIEIDYEAAKDLLNKSNLDFEQYNSWNCSIDMIHFKDWFFVVDKTAGRVHNNITNLSKNFRPFLKFNNQKLVEIDISNSQPLLFNILISRYLFRYTNYCGIILPYVPQNSDLRFYKELTEQGKFYEYLMEEFGIYEDRSLFKVRFFSKVFYSKEIENEEREKFKKLFPGVADIISYYKKVNYRDLAIQLQRIEADIMINSIVPRLANRNIFMITIHDSILTTPDNLKLVKEVIMNEFEKYNLQPTLKIKI
jgi:hypothetical protein